MSASNNHTCLGGQQQASFKIGVVFQNGAQQSCPSLFFASPRPTSANSSCSSPNTNAIWSPPSSFTADVVRYNSGIGSGSATPTWQQGFIDLSGYLGQTITIFFVSTDCSASGHFGYTYIDTECGELGVTVTTPSYSTFVSSPTASVNLQAQCGQTATLSAPIGASGYTWTGPPTWSAVAVNSSSIQTNVGGTFTLFILQSGGCLPATRIVSLTFAPLTTLAATPGTICSSGLNSTATLSVTGASNYTWMPGNSNLNSYIVTPTITTIYTLTAVTGTCSGTKTLQVTVNSAPTITATSGNACSGSTVALTAGGAGIGGTYTWSPGSVNGSPATFTPVANTTYTVIGTSILTGCTGSVTTNVTVTGSLTLQHAINAFLPLGATLVPTVCIGGNLVGFVNGGIASQYTWTAPGNTVVGANVTLNPTITGPYTITANNGACISSTITQNVVVDPGPTMTVTPSISTASICAGTSTVIIATSSVAPITYSWNTGATTSSISVTPSVTTSYTVYGTKVSTGCISSSVTNIFVFPQPTITLSSFVNVTATSSICVGGTITGVASGAGVGGTYTWMPGNLNGTPQTLSPIVTTTYIVTGTSASGCTNTAQRTITVVPNPTLTATANPTAICLGAASTLSASGSTSYLWSTSAITASISVTPITVGTSVYTVTGSTAGCTGSITVSVTVNPLPVVTAVASPTSICPGGSAILTGGGGSTSLWNTGATTATISVFPITTTGYTVTGTSVFGCTSSAAVTLTVNPIPTILLTPASASICVGGSISIGASGASTYTWLPGNLNGTPQTLSPTVTTIYTVTGTSASGCTNTAQRTITVVPNPTITATATPTAICLGAASTLSASGSTSYLWSTTAITASISVTPITVGTSVYTVTGTTAGCSGSTTVSVTVNPLPVVTAIASPTSICPGGSAILTGGGGSTYLWNPGGATTNTIVVSPTVTTGYTVTGTSVFGCTSTAAVTLSVNPTPTIVLTPASASICAGGSISIGAS